MMMIRTLAVPTMKRTLLQTTRSRRSTTIPALPPSAPVSASAVAVSAVASATTRSSRRGITRRIWEIYTSSLSHSPLTTKATMAAFIFFVSDSVTQYIFFDSNNSNQNQNQTQFTWDGNRAMSGATFGIVATTWLHSWWGFLEGFVGARIPVQQYRLANTLTKVVIDQAIGAPLYIYSYYVITNIVNQITDITNPTGDQLSKAWETTNAKACNMLLPTMFQHWKVWPVIHSLNFYFVPLHHRVLVQNTVLVGWSGYLSYLNNNNNNCVKTTAAAATKTKAVTDKNRLMTPDEEIKVAMKRRQSVTITRQKSATSRRLITTAKRRPSSSLAVVEPATVAKQTAK